MEGHFPSDWHGVEIASIASIIAYFILFIFYFFIKVYTSTSLIKCPSMTLSRIGSLKTMDRHSSSVQYSNSKREWNYEIRIRLIKIGKDTWLLIYFSSALIFIKKKSKQSKTNWNNKISIHTYIHTYIYIFTKHDIYKNNIQKPKIKSGLSNSKTLLMGEVTAKWYSHGDGSFKLCG